MTTHRIAAGRYKSERSRMYKRKSDPPHHDCRSRATYCTLEGDCTVVIDLDRLREYFARAVANKKGRSQLAKGAIKFIASNVKTTMVPLPSWVVTEEDQPCPKTERS